VALNYHTDGVGSVLGISDDTATVVETQAYDPFGVTLAQNSSGNLTNAYQFVGAYGVRHIDLPGNQPVGFDHSIMGVRMYDATNGRFTTEDPLGFTADINLFRYTMNEPLLYFDSTGLCPVGPTVKQFPKFPWYVKWFAPQKWTNLIKAFDKLSYATNENCQCALNELGNEKYVDDFDSNALLCCACLSGNDSLPASCYANLLELNKLFLTAEGK